jgi:hypothetical protein
MKTLVKWLKKLWFKLFPKQAIKQIDNKLQKAVIDKQKQKITLLYEIKDYMVNTLKIDKKSKFIPLSIRHEACKKVNKNFGERMKQHHLKLNINLEIVKSK